MPCAETNTRLQAYFDGELDAISAADIEQHMEDCSECRQALRELGDLRSAMHRDLTFVRAPPELRARIVAALDRETVGAAAPTAERASERKRPERHARSFWTGAAAGIGAAALAASVAFFAVVPASFDPMLDGLVSAHVRSLMPQHLIDVESTDRHTVKPWFAGHADVSPVVADFAEQGYKLVGGRADYFEHQRAAVVVYQHGPHIINVFSWSRGAHAPPGNTTRNGYHLAFWSVGNLDYCAVSDTGWDELLGLEALMKAGSDPRG